MFGAPGESIPDRLLAFRLMLPSAHINRVGVRVVSFRSSIAHPAYTPIYASLSPWRLYQRSLQPADRQPQWEPGARPATSSPPIHKLQVLPEMEIFCHAVTWGKLLRMTGPLPLTSKYQGKRANTRSGLRLA